MPQREPLVKRIYTADPSAHVFDGRIYVYVSHDLDLKTQDEDLGDHFLMTDYHVLIQNDPLGPAVDGGEILHLGNVPWAVQKMWAPDAACKDGRYYLYFPAKDGENRFKIGVAVASHPQGPFVAEPQPIEDSFSIDPCSFRDDDGSHYLYFGGLWGGQLQYWEKGRFDVNVPRLPPPEDDAICPKAAKLRPDMLGFESKPRDLPILDEEGRKLKVGDRCRRYFEGPWMHKYRGTYYFSYSTGDTHTLVYATAKDPMGPFTFRGTILSPVIGWTTHHSIVEFQGRWYLYYHDASLSGGDSAKRCVKVQELFYDDQGGIIAMTP